MTRCDALISVTLPADCPLIEIDKEIEGELDLLSWSAGLTEENEEYHISEQFTIGVNRAEDQSEIADPGDSLTAKYDSTHKIKFDNDKVELLHELMESVISHEVSNIKIREGDIKMHFHVNNGAEIQDILTDLRQKYSKVSLTETFELRGEDGEMREVDLSMLTQRQKKVMETAYNMGYFKYPKESNGTEVAEELGISRSTFSEHISAAQMKVGSQVFLQ